MPCTPYTAGGRRLLGSLLAWVCGGRACGFPNPPDEALLLSEDSEPQGAQASTVCKPIWPEEALKSKVAAGTKDPLDRQQ